MTVETLDRGDGEREIVERARCGDREAFDRLFEQHRRMLTAVCRRALKGRGGGVDEVVQDTAVAARLAAPGSGRSSDLGRLLEQQVQLDRRHRRPRMTRTIR